MQRQLAEAFPTRSAEERAQIERDFYHWFADYVVETLKLMSISRKELYRRMDFVNLHEVLREFAQWRASICVSLSGTLW